MDIDAFFLSPLAIYVGTCDGELKPEIARAWGPQQLPDGSVCVFLDRAPGERTLANLDATGKVAVTFSSLADYTSLQLKGSLLEAGPPSVDDLACVDTHRKVFCDAALSMGLQMEIVRQIWSEDVVRLRFMPSSRFTQTPGVGAGASL